MWVHIYRVNQNKMLWFELHVSFHYLIHRNFYGVKSSLQTMENVQNIPSAYISGNHEKFNCTTKKKKSIHYNPSYSMCAFSPHFSKPVVQITHQIVYLHQDVSYNKWCHYSTKHKSFSVSKPALSPVTCFSF